MQMNTYYIHIIVLVLRLSACLFPPANELIWTTGGGPLGLGISYKFLGPLLRWIVDLKRSSIVHQLIFPKLSCPLVNLSACLFPSTTKSNWTNFKKRFSRIRASAALTLSQNTFSSSNYEYQWFCGLLAQKVDYCPRLLNFFYYRVSFYGTNP